MEPNDPILEAEVERALAPYKDLLPPELVQQMREVLTDALTTHPVAARMMDRLRPPPVVQQSEEVERGGGEARAPDKRDKSGTGRGQ